MALADMCSSASSSALSSCEGISMVGTGFYGRNCTRFSYHEDPRIELVLEVLPHHRVEARQLCLEVIDVGRPCHHAALSLCPTPEMHYLLKMLSESDLAAVSSRCCILRPAWNMRRMI